MEFYEDDWMQSYGSKVVYPFAPKPEDFEIEVVAHALALKTRFNGHCNFFYSVAQHCVLVSRFCSPENALWGLLHELDEVFLPDIPRPIKRELPFWGEISEKHMQAGAKAFNLQCPVPKEVKYVDAAALCSEMHDVMSEPPKAWGSLPPRLEQQILPMTWQEAKAQFMARFKELTHGK